MFSRFYKMSRVTERISVVEGHATLTTTNTVCDKQTQASNTDEHCVMNKRITDKHSVNIVGEAGSTCSDVKR